MKFIDLNILLKDNDEKLSYDPVKYTDEYGFVVSVDDLLNAATVEIEPLTDEEKRIFLAAMGKEEKLCQNIEELWEKLNLRSANDIDLVKVCKEIERKVKKALWKN